MAFLVPFLSLAFISLPQLAQANMLPFCESNTGKYEGPKLPKLPNAFIAQVEAKIVDRNYSILMTEYYDQAANKGALRRVRDGRSVYTIYNYDENEMMVIDEETRHCTLQDIQTMHGWPFFGRNGSKIEGIADLFRFGSQFNETYLGNATVRGIPCFHWQACINHKNHSYLVDYFFSTPGWSMPSGEMQVVRATINGTSNMSYHYGNHSLPSNFTRSYYHVYDFFSFKSGRPPAPAFQIPRGVFCAGMKDRKTLPLLPSVFSLEIESVHTSEKAVSNFKEHYDIDRNLVMFQSYDFRHKGYTETRIIQDFKHGVIYNISGFVCRNVTLLTLNNTRWDSKETKDHHLRMKTSTELLFDGNKSALMYIGAANVRGIDADVWVMKKESVRHHREVTTEYYFSKPSWSMQAGSLRNQSQVLLRIDFYNTNNSFHTMNILNFDGESVPLHVFSIGPCFVGERYIISLRFMGEWKRVVYKQELEFNIAARNSIAEAAKVSNLRIDNLKNGEGDHFIQIWFTLLGKPPVMSPDAPHENDLKEAVESLKKKVMGNELVIKWTNPVTKAPMKVTADKEYFYNSMVNPTTRPTHGRDKKHQKSKGVPGGTVAGVAVLMVAIGICIGLGIAHVIMKRRGAALFQYQRQE